MKTKEILKREARHFILRNTRNILQVHGVSMYPSLQEGWSAEVVPAEGKDLEIGDIIVFEMENEFIVHRIVGSIKNNNKTYLLQKGDNDSLPHFIKEDQVLGKASRIFDSNHQEVPSKLWKYQDKNERIMFKLFYIVYLIPCRVKRFFLEDNKNALISFFWRYYWKLFFKALKAR